MSGFCGVLGAVLCLFIGIMIAVGDENFVTVYGAEEKVQTVHWKGKVYKLVPLKIEEEGE